LRRRRTSQGDLPEPSGGIPDNARTIKGAAQGIARESATETNPLTDDRDKGAALDGSDNRSAKEFETINGITTSAEKVFETALNVSAITATQRLLITKWKLRTEKSSKRKLDAPVLAVKGKARQGPIYKKQHLFPLHR
jgi:hypothetical protein